MTLTFVICIVAFIVGYDAVLAYKKKKTVTAVFRHLYMTFVFCPFAVGVIALGHFLDLIVIDKGWQWTVGGLCGFGIPMLILSIVLSRKKITVPKWLVPIIIIAGYCVGDIFF